MMVRHKLREMPWRVAEKSPYQKIAFLTYFFARSIFMRNENTKEESYGWHAGILKYSNEIWKVYPHGRMLPG